MLHMFFGALLAAWSWNGAAACAEGSELQEELGVALSRLGSPDFNAREAARDKALSVFDRIFLQAAEGLNSADLEIKHGTQEILRQISVRLHMAATSARARPDARPALKEWLTTNATARKLASYNPADRMEACDEAAAKAPSGVSLPILFHLCYDPDAKVQRSALKKLGQLGLLEALPVLVEATAFQAHPAVLNFPQKKVLLAVAMDGEDLDCPVSQTAIAAIGNLQHEDSARFLVGRLGSPVGGTVANYIRALACTGQPKPAVPELMKFIGDARRMVDLEKQFRKSCGMGEAFAAMPPLGEATVGDAAIAAIVELTKQDEAAYGFVAKKSVDAFFGVPGTLFKDEKTRQEAIVKLEKWYGSWKR